MMIDGKRMLPLIMIIGYVVGCGGQQGHDPLPTTGVTAVATWPPTSAAGSGQDLLPTATLLPPATRMPPATTASRPTVIATAPVAFIPDDEPCVRLEPEGIGAGGGQALLDVSTGEAVLMRLKGHTSAPRYAAFSPDGQTIVTADWGDVRLWHADTGRLMHVFDGVGIPGIPSFSPDGSLLAGGIEGQKIRLWDVTTGIRSHNLTFSTEGGTFAHLVGFSPDGQQIAAAVGRSIILLDAVTGAIVQELSGDVFDEEELVGENLLYIGNGHSGWVTSLAYSASGQVLLSSGFEGTLRLWDASTGRHLRCFNDDDGPLGWLQVGPMALSSDGMTAIASSGSEIYLWNAVDGRLRSRWETQTYGPRTWITSLHFRTDDGAILAGMTDQAARIYDATNGTLSGLLHHSRRVEWAEFSPDGRRIVTAIGQFNDATADPIYEVWIWDATHPDVALAAAAQNLQEEGIELTRDGNVAAGIRNFEQAQAINLNPEIWPHYWNLLCRYGSLWDRAADVMFACELAVELATHEMDQAEYRGNRGIARALTGDYLGAIDDFTAFVDYFEDYYPYAEGVALREEWIAALQADRNPFDPATLEALRAEEDDGG